MTAVLFPTAAQIAAAAPPGVVIHEPALRVALRTAEHGAEDPIDVPAALLHALAQGRVFRPEDRADDAVVALVPVAAALVAVAVLAGPDELLPLAAAARGGASLATIADALSGRVVPLGTGDGAIG